MAILVHKDPNPVREYRSCENTTLGEVLGCVDVALPGNI
jgi:hypothetical protein